MESELEALCLEAGKLQDGVRRADFLRRHPQLVNERVV
jgi:hypothetical protein